MGGKLVILNYCVFPLTYLIEVDGSPEVYNRGPCRPPRRGWSHINSAKSCKVPARGYRAPKNAFWSLLQSSEAGGHKYAPQKAPVFGGPPAKTTDGRDVPKNVYGVAVARKSDRPLPKKVTTRFLGTARPDFGPLGTIFGRNSSPGDLVRSYVTTL
jgi:hypothetical protein